MPTKTILDAEAKLISDHDGSYRSQLIQRLEKYRDEFVFAAQGFLPPAEYQTTEGMIHALEAALVLVREYTPPESNDDTVAAEANSDDSAVGTMFSI